MEAKSKMRWVEWDGLRGLLAFWVFLDHVFVLGLGQEILPQYLLAGNAVHVFFCLSGFVVFHLVERRESYGLFLARRFLRIYPVYFICLVLASIVTWYHPVRASDHDFFLWNIFAHLLNAHGLVPFTWIEEAHLTLFGPAWSISTEWQFYLLAPFLVLIFTKYSRASTLAWGLVLILRGLYHAHCPLVEELTASVFAKMEYFFAGMVAYKFAIRSDKALSSFSVEAALLVCLFVYLCTKDAALLLWSTSCLVVLSRPGEKWGCAFEILRKILKSSTIQKLGLISYSLYLCHDPLLKIAQLIYERCGLSLGSNMVIMHLCVSQPLILGLAWLSHCYVEKPWIDWGRKLAKTLPNQTA
jgi:peptidoglycan/LPS O-acetylase OafA/YrhL